MFSSSKHVSDIQSSIRKACNPDDAASKRKHVRACIVYTWDNKSSKDFWENLKTMHLKDNDTSLFKSLILIHKVLQEGHPSCLVGGYKNMNWISNLDTLRTMDRRYQVLIPEYVNYILQKLRFHHNHRGFNGTFEYEEYVSLRTVSDPNEGYDAILDLLSLQDALDTFARDIFVAIRKDRSEAIISALVPIVAESYGIYKFLISMLRALYRTADSTEILEPLRTRFDDQHTRLYDLYERCSSINYLATLITVPKLPYDPPNLVTENENEALPPPIQEQKTAATFSTPPSSNENETKPITSQPTGAVSNAFMQQQRAYELQQQQLERQREAELQQQQQLLLQQQQYWEEEQRKQAESQQLAQQQLLLQQAQSQAQGRVAELERDILALKGQYDNDQLMLQSFDQKVQALEAELATTTETAQQQLASKDEQLNYLQEQVNYWKNKYESLAKLYSQLRTEHLNLLAKSKKIQQKAASAQEAIEKREKLEREMKAKNIELADLIKERDRARLELERFKNGNKSELQVLQLEKNDLEEKLATLERAQSANLTAIFSQHNKEIEELQKKLNDMTLTAPNDEKMRKLEELLQEKDLELEMMQQTMDETIKELVGQQNEKVVDQKNVDEVVQRAMARFTSLVDAILKSGIKRIQDAVFEVESPMQAGNVNSSPEYLLTLIEKTSSLSTDFALSFTNFLADGVKGDEVTIIDGVTNFTTSIVDILLNTKGLTRLTQSDEFQDDLLDTAKDVAEISQVFLESLFHQNLQSLSIDAQTDVVINGNIDVQEILQNLIQLVDTLKIPSSKLDLNKVTGELSDLVDKEMENASKVIEDASSHLMSLLNQPFDSSMTELDIEVSKSILASASAIITAIKYLIQASIESQQEIVNNGRGSNSRTSFYKKNNKWTEGLISAAKSIAYSTNTLIRTADGVLQNKHSNEELVVASKEVAASTAQLVSAARVKSEFMSKTQNKLEDASKKVNYACKQLVDRVQKLINDRNDLDEIDYSKLSIYENKTAEMEQQVQILKLENALSSARKRLGEIRKFSYRDD
ncbi:hypothetical protein CANINC_004845, partial [Pichia inconspicua]